MKKPLPMDEETLLAYVDGEVDASTALEVEVLLARDEAAAQFVAEQRALRQQLQSVFQPVLDEAVPSHLEAAARALADRAQARAPASGGSGVTAAWNALRRRVLSLRPAGAGGLGGAAWAGMAASLMLGLMIGRQLPGDEESLVAAAGQELVAEGPLAQALSTQLAATQERSAPIRMGLSFVSRDGNYCRSFVLPARDTAGLACRTGQGWELQLLARAEPQPEGSFRQAASALPQAVLAAIDARIEGESLDADAEQRALRQGWQRAATPSSPR